MQIIASKGLFMLEGCSPAKKGLPQRAGFRWHDPPKCTNCTACAYGMPKKRWWTDKADKVVALAVLISKTPGEPALDLRGHQLEVRIDQEIKQATGQVDWLTRLERQTEDKDRP